MATHLHRLALASVPAFVLALAMLWLLDDDERRHGTLALVEAAAFRYVSLSGDDTANLCTNSASPCATVQHAVDVAKPTDEVRIAAGSYTGVSPRARNDLTTTGTVTQLVYVTKTLTIRGGFTTTNWTTPDPTLNVTTLDAQGLGRVFYITDYITPTLSGLRMTGGNARGQRGGNSPTDDAGGGLYVLSATITLSNNVIFSNTTSNVPSINWGGGLYIRRSTSVLSGNSIVGNGSYAGGGVYLLDSIATINGNTISGNTASGQGGGGLFLVGGAARLSGNTITDNSGGVGGGVRITGGSDAIFTNTVIADNCCFQGAGVHIAGSSPRFLHSTIARNSGSAGIYATNVASTFSHIALTNTILVSHTLGITVAAGNTATLNSVLWSGNAANTGGSGSIVASNEVTGNPVFAADGYHILDGSAAIDRGVDAGVPLDIDAQTRYGAAPDLGVDELNLLPGGTRYVANGGVDSYNYCTNSGIPCAGVQRAVDLAFDGDQIRIAAGTYAGVNVRPRNDVTTAGTVTQVLFLNKTVTVTGGFTRTNWGTSNPALNVTTLDAQGQGRVIYVTGNVSPTIEGLRIMHGNAAGQHGSFANDAGGGVYIYHATALLRNDAFISNTTLITPAALNNLGGAVYLHQSPAIVQDNTFVGNTSQSGGALTVFLSAARPAVVYGNLVVSNTAVAEGGGMFLRGNATVVNNLIRGNLASVGGGVRLVLGQITMINNVVVDNVGTFQGSGLHIFNSHLQLLHTTIAHNTGGNGAGVEIVGLAGFSSTVHMTNTIISNQTIGITATANTTTTADGILFYANGNNPCCGNFGGGGYGMFSHVYYGDPAFAPDGYHLTVGSSAIDSGVIAGVPTDIDGNLRTVGLAPDLGADEYANVVNKLLLPLIVR